MGKDTSNQKNASGRNKKPYDASNSFVQKVANRVSGIFGGFFSNTTIEEASPSDVSDTEAEPQRPTLTSGNLAAHASSSTSNNTDVRNHIDRPSNQESVNKDEVFMFGSSSVRQDIDAPGPSGLCSQRLAEAPQSTPIFSRVGKRVVGNHRLPSSSGPRFDAAESRSDYRVASASGKLARLDCGDDKSESSESTSGCSSLVPQADRLSQPASGPSYRRKSQALDEKLSYVRQIKQSRPSFLMNRSIPVDAETPRPSRTPGFDITTYGRHILNKSARETMLCSPFYTGHTTYGGAAARPNRIPAAARTPVPVTPLQKPEGLQMSQTARTILAALEEFSSPLNDAKRLPTSIPPLAAKRRNLEASSGPTPAKRQALAVPTTADMLKMERREKMQKFTEMAGKMALQGSGIRFDQTPVPELPKVALEFTTLPKFDVKLPPSPVAPKFAFSAPIVAAPSSLKISTTSNVKQFTFSAPLPVGSAEPPSPEPTRVEPEKSVEKTSQGFGDKFKPAAGSWSCNVCMISNTAASDKCVACETPKPLPPPASTTSQPTGFGDKFKPAAGSWSCSECLLSNTTGSVKCVACEAPKPGPKPTQSDWKPCVIVCDNSEPKKPESTGFGDKFKPAAGSWSCSVCMVSNAAASEKCVACETAKPTSGFGDKFKPSSGSWSCSTCMIRNNETVTKCVACETPKETSGGVPKVLQAFGSSTPTISQTFSSETPKSTNGPKIESWKCSVCLINNNASAKNCAACDTPKSGAAMDAASKPQFDFGLPPGGCGFKFGIDPVKEESKPKPADPKPAEVKPTVTAPSFSFGVPKTEPTPAVPETPKFQFGVPPTKEAEKTPAVAPEKPAPITFTKPEVQPFTFGAPAKEASSPFTFGAKRKAPEESEASQPSLFNNTSKLNAFQPADATPKPFVFGSPAPNDNSVAPTPATNSFAIGTSSTFGSMQNAKSLQPPAVVPSFSATPTLPTTFGATNSFGAAPSAFAVNNKFGAPATSTPSTTPSFGVTPSVTPSFGVTPSTAPSFGATPSTTPSFGATPSVTSSFGATFGGTSTFGAPTPTPSPFATPFSTNSSAPAFGTGFGSAAPAPAFGSEKSATPSAFGVSSPFGSATSEVSGFGATPAMFGAPASTTPFGVASRFAASEAPSPAFGAGATAAPTAAPAAAPFQFGAVNSSPAPSFSLSVPSAFNFTGGQTPTFNAVNAEPRSTEPKRRIIRAMRRSQR